MAVKSTPNLVDLVWENRPDRPCNPVFHLEPEYSGVTAGEKFATVSQSL
jgi:Xaa-Pro aminopeptidase